mgnify:FL=1
MTLKNFADFCEEYEPRIKTYLQLVRDYLHLSGYTTKQIGKRRGIDWAFQFTAFIGTEQPIRVLFGVLKSEDYGDAPNAGIACELMVEEIGGRLIDGWDPFAEKKGTWHSLSRPNALEKHFRSLESINPQEVLNIVEIYRKEKFDERDQTSS